MVFVSRRESWWAAYAVLAVALAYHVERRAVWLLPIAGGAVWLADRISSSWFKPFFQRLRPCHDPALARTIRLVESYGCGGQFGFMSSHAANTAALATFLSAVLPRRFRVAKSLLVAWSVLTGYSRVYLGAHFPGDVLAGWVLGSGLGLGAAWLYRRLTGYPAKD